MGHGYLPRMVEDKVRGLFSTFPIVIITGARQVGKSTLLAHTFPQIPAVTFDPVTDVENARADPGLFLNNRLPPLILDEIQYAPELIPAIKRRIDKDRKGGQYLITGSQQWGVMKLLSESLAGRAVFLDLEGLTFLEFLGEGTRKPWLANWIENKGHFSNAVQPVPSPFSLVERIWRGSLPETAFLKNHEIPSFLSGYQRTYVERDLRQMAEISDLQLFGRFFRLCGALTAQEVNFSHFGREIGITPQTATRWLHLLNGTYQWFEIPAYSGNTIKRISGKSKGHLGDTGLACLALAISSPEAVLSHPQWGSLFETLIVGEIRKQCRLLDPLPNLYHWRSHGGAEVDLILERDGIYYPIEIKGKSHPTLQDTRGVESFKKKYPQLSVGTALVLCTAETSFPLSKSVVVVPWNSQLFPY